MKGLPLVNKLLFVILILSALLKFQLNATTIFGFVKDKESGEPLYLVNIWIKGTSIGTTSNEKGYYVLTDIPTGKQIVVFSYIGYQPLKQKFNLKSNEEIRFDVSLKPSLLTAEKIVTTAKREDNIKEIKPGQVTLNARQIRYLPQIAEPDLFRTLQMLPGVATLSDFSAGLYIRGGSPDQNLILLDQIDVYNPNHLFGFFSTFNADALKSVELLKGGFPAQFGGRLSSVLNVQNKDGNRQRFGGLGRISLISSSLTLEGPWSHGSWMLSGRRTYLELVAKLLDLDLPYYFYDSHGKVNFDLDKNNRATLSFYLGDDKLDLSNSGININLLWGNRTFSANWMHLFSGQLYSNFVVAASRFRSRTKVDFDNVAFGLFNRIDDLSVKGMLTYAPGIKHTIDLGMEVKYLIFQLNNLIVDEEYKNEYHGIYSAFYLQDNIKLNALTALQPGLRISYYSKGNYFRLEPRVALRRFLSRDVQFTLAYGKYFQYLNLVQRGGLSFADIWFPVDQTFKPGHADHFILGLKYDVLENLSIDMEAYYKKYFNVAEYREFRSADESLENQTAAQNFLPGKGHAYGIDLLLKNNVWLFNGWLGYSLAWTKRKTENYNFGLEYYPTFDRRHTVTLVQNFNFWKNWKFNLAYKYGSGQPFTQPTARFAALTPDGRLYYYPLYGRKNMYRLPNYHRLDIGLFKQWTILGLPVEFYVQVINVFDHKNVWFRKFNTQDNPATIDDQEMLPRLPTFGFSFKF